MCVCVFVYIFFVILFYFFCNFRIWKKLRWICRVRHTSWVKFKVSSRANTLVIVVVVVVVFLYVYTFLYLEFHASQHALSAILLRCCYFFLQCLLYLKLRILYTVWRSHAIAANFSTHKTPKWQQQYEQKTNMKKQCKYRKRNSAIW